MTESKTEAAEAPAPPSRPDLTGEPIEYPKMMFRPGHQVRVWDQYDVDTLVVQSEAAEKDALEHGWFLNPADMDEGGGKPEQQDKDEDYDPTRDPANIAYDPYKDPSNPRPGEPDTAPFRNTPHNRPQSGDLPDPPTSPAEPPVQAPIPPEEPGKPGEKPEPTPGESSADDDDEESLRRKGAPPGSKRVK